MQLWHESTWCCLAWLLYFKLESGSARDVEVLCRQYAHEGLYIGDAPVRPFVASAEFLRECGRVKRNAGSRQAIPVVVPEVQEFVRHAYPAFEETHAMCSNTFDQVPQGVLKYNKAQPEVNRMALKLACSWAERHWFGHCSGSIVWNQARVMQEADRTTSPGWPWVLWYKTKGDFLDSEEFQEYYRKYNKSLETDKPMKAFWSANLKQELLKKTKIASGKRRLFTGSATEHSLALNEMCGHFNEMFYASALKTWSWVGMGKYHRGFQLAHEKLSQHPNVFECDETEYDSSLFRLLLEAVCEMRFAFLKEEYRTEENHKKLRNLYEQIIYSYMVMPWGDVIQKETGNPSGSANTIVDNTIILFILLSYAWIVLQWRECRRKGEPETALAYPAFMENVSAVLCGDDNTFSVSDACVGWYNGVCIPVVWKELNITATAENEGKAMRLTDPFGFCSHDFRIVKWKGEECILPVCDTNKALCSLMWGGFQTDPRYILLRAFALRNETWPNEVCRKVIAAFIVEFTATHREELNGCFKIGDEEISWTQVERSYKTDDEIWTLYTQGDIEASNSAGLDKTRIVGLELNKCQESECEVEDVRAEFKEGNAKGQVQTKAAGLDDQTAGVGAEGDAKADCTRERAAEAKRQLQGGEEGCAGSLDPEEGENVRQHEDVELHHVGARSRRPHRRHGGSYTRGDRPPDVGHNVHQPDDYERCASQSHGDDVRALACQAMRLHLHSAMRVGHAGYDTRGVGGQSIKHDCNRRLACRRLVVHKEERLQSGVKAMLVEYAGAGVQRRIRVVLHVCRRCRRPSANDSGRVLLRRPFGDADHNGSVRRNGARVRDRVRSSCASNVDAGLWCGDSSYCADEYAPWECRHDGKYQWVFRANVRISRRLLSRKCAYGVLEVHLCGERERSRNDRLLL